MSDASPDGERDQPGDTMRERASTSGRWFRLLVETDRLLLVAALLVAIVVALVAVGMIVPKAAVLFTSGDPIETTFQAFVGATITGVTLVVTLNQLVLSQEFGAVGDQRERMDAAVQFREDVESVLEAPITPPEPAAFLRALVDVTGERAETLRERVADDDALDEGVRDRVCTLAEDISANADAVADSLDGSQFGTFGVLSAALDFNYSWKLYSARRVRAEDDASLSEAQSAAVDDLVETLELFGPAREHFKTLYFQWELTALSRVILAAALPSLVVSVSMVLFYDPAAIVGSVVGLPWSLLVVSGAVAVALVPFLVLLSHVLRIAVVTQRTLSIGPFTLRETDREESIEWE
ncbi:MAG: hypothetical protein ABEI57_07620 [Halapricum sp.]